MSFDSANNKGGIQGHSQGEYFPVTIVTIGNPAPFAHVVQYGGVESGRFSDFAAAERFARAVRSHIDDGDSDSAKLLLEISRGDFLGV